MIQTIHKSTTQQNVNLPKHIIFSIKAEKILNIPGSPAEKTFNLLNSECYADAIMYLAFSIPQPQSIAWACNIIRTYNYNDLTDAEDKVLSATENWCHRYHENNEKFCIPEHTLPTNKASSWVSLAAYWGHTKISNEENYKLDQDGLSNEALYSAIMLSLQNIDTNKKKQAFIETIEKGIVTFLSN